jgi:methionine synthase I (cobalamin-dependent)
MGDTSLIQKLIADGPVLTDGAWGTELQARGLAPGELPDSWNLSHPGRVEEVARAYVDAGSRVILTNTFRANGVALERYSLHQRVRDINRAGAEISKRAAGDRALVFASIGPTGKMLATGEIEESQMSAAFAEQSQALADAGADGLVVETMADLTEARLAVQAAIATGLPVVACMVFDSGKKRDRTMTGVTTEQAAVELTRAGAHAIGANCGIGVEESVGLCQSLASATERPIWIKPNAGLPEFVDGKVVYPTDPEAFASYLPKLVAVGASFIGCCCGSNPRFVEALRGRLAASKQD